MGVMLPGGTDSRRAINASIAIMALLVFVLAGNTAWNAYNDHRGARLAVRVNAMTDKVILAATLQAVERGMTAAALGAGAVPAVETRRRLDEARAQGDSLWREALAMASSVALELPGARDFAAAVVRATEDYRALEDVRTRVDASLAAGGAGTAVSTWINAITRFIASAQRVSDSALAAAASGGDIARLNAAIKQPAWLISEHAGLERGTLAFYIAARRPVPSEVLDELRASRALITKTLRVFLDLGAMPDTDPAIARAIHEMEQAYFGRFNAQRSAVYGAARSGGYPISAARWMEQATDAIASILGVVTATSRVIDAKARHTAHRSVNSLVVNLAFIAAALGLTLFGIVRVVRTANTLFHEKELAEVTLHSIGDAVIATDADALIEYLNPVAEELTLWTNAEAKGLPLKQVFNIFSGSTHEPVDNPVERCLREQRIIGLEENTVLLRRDGTELVIDDSAAPVRDRAGKIVGAVMVFFDASKSRNMPHLLSYQATHDALTGLVNRREFERRLGELLAEAKESGTHHVLCYIDLDQFKVVNDTCGHVAGDKLLRQLAYLLKKRMRDSDMLARLGGDEFGVLLDSCSLDEARGAVDGLRDVIHDFRFAWEGKTFEIGASVGIVAITPDSVSSVELLSEADAACYAAKDKGRNRVQVHQPGDAELTRRHGEMQWVSRITQSIEEDRFRLYYQTIVQTSRGRAGHVHYEILLRLADEDGGVILPAVFIPAAERFNLMPAVDRWVVRNALAAVVERHRARAGASGSVCFINLSGASLGDEHFLDFVRDQLAEHKVPRGAVCFEITETAAVANLDHAVTFIETLRAAGCRFALDDFGTGLSSFAYLRNLPVDYLKIAGTFVRHIIDNPLDATMVDTIHRVGQVMGIKTIAEWVENEVILARLKEMGVDYAQGFFVSQPRPLSDLDADAPR